MRIINSDGSFGFTLYGYLNWHTVLCIFQYSMDRNQIHHLHTEILSRILFWNATIPITVNLPQTPFLAVFQYTCKWQRINSIRNKLVWPRGLLERWSCKRGKQKGNLHCQWLSSQNSNSLPLPTTHPPQEWPLGKSDIHRHKTNWVNIFLSGVYVTMAAFWLAICEVVSNLLNIISWIISSFERGSLGTLLYRTLGRWGLAEEMGGRPPNVKENRSICSPLLTPLLREHVKRF